MTFSFFAILQIIQILSAIIGGTLFAIFKCLPTSRRGVVAFGFFWVLICTAEFWILGPWSFITMSNELDYAPPFYTYLKSWHDGGSYTHAWAGGGDIYSMMATGAQYLSIERELVGFMPFWMANAVHKIFVAGIGFFGCYRSSRALNADRSLATALAAFCVLAFDFVVDTTWFTGVGYAIIPLAVYIIVFRIGRPHYWLGVSIIAFSHASSSEPVHSIPVLMTVLSIAALFFATRKLPTILAAILIMMLFVLFNWHEVLFGLNRFSAETNRSSVGLSGWGSLAVEWETFLFVTGRYGFLPILIMALLLPLRLRAFEATLRIGAVITSLLVGPILLFMPWSAFGLGFIDAVNFRYVYSAAPFVCLLVLATTVPKLLNIKHFAMILIVATTAGNFAWYKAYHAAVWLSEGGVANFNDERIPVSPNDALASGVRVVSVPYRWSANHAPAMGFNALDGFPNLLSLRLKTYWEKGVMDPERRRENKPLSPGNSNFLQPVGIDFDCCPSFDLSSIIDIPLLGVANVGLVLSAVPLTGSGIRQIAGPVGPTAVPNKSGPLLDRIFGLIVLNFFPPELRVYQVSQYLPSVYVAHRIETYKDDFPTKDLLDSIAQNGINATALVSETANVHLHAEPSLRLADVKRTADGYIVNVEAPDGGVIIFNKVASQFWQAVIDGTVTETVPVNMIHTAVQIPPHARNITLRFHRPLLRERLFSKHAAELEANIPNG